MVSAKDILKQVEKITANLIELGLCEEQNFPLIKDLSGSIKEVNISNDNSLFNSSIFLKNISYIDMYNELCNHKIFNMKMLDGALIQMQYRFKDNFIEKHRLAFFPSPNLEVFQNEPEVYMYDNIYSDIIDKRIVTVPLRFDFDDSVDKFGEKVAKPVSHPISHLTIGQYKNCRIPVSSALTPYQFIDFIIRNFYNTVFNMYSNKIVSDNCYFEECMHIDERKIINICSPNVKRKK